MKNKKIVLIFAICLMMVAGAGIGGTVAYLAASSNTVTNTFTYGDVNISLVEHKNGSDGAETTLGNTGLKIIPGKDIPKDPFIRVKAGSESSWIYVVIKEVNWPDQMSYALDTGWIEITGAQGIDISGGEKLYGYNSAQSGDAEINILKNMKVVVDTALTKPTGSETPQLIFKAYAIQEESGNSAENAWKAINTSGLSSDFKESN